MMINWSGPPCRICPNPTNKVAPVNTSDKANPIVCFHGNPDSSFARCQCSSVLGLFNMSNHPHHVYHGENKHPYNVKEVPVEPNNEQLPCSNSIHAAA